MPALVGILLWNEEIKPKVTKLQLKKQKNITIAIIITLIAIITLLLHSIDCNMADKLSSLSKSHILKILYINENITSIAFAL